MRRLPRLTATAVLITLAAAVAAAASHLKPGGDPALLTGELAKTEQRFGPTSPRLLPILASLAQARVEQGELVDATALRRRSLKIAIAEYGSASVPAAQAMAALAGLYIERRRYLDAEPLAIAAANLLRERRGASDPALAPGLADRARIALARGDHDAARKSAEAAIDIDTKNQGGPRSADLRALGAVLSAEDRFADAKRVLQQALALDRAEENKLAIARDLALLATAALRQKRFAEALPLIEEAALIDQSCLGPTHPLIAEDFRDLGLIYLATNRPADAAKALRMGIDLLERGDGRDTPTRAYLQLDLARAEHALGHDDKAHSLFIAARRILNAAETKEHDRQRET